jgi:hypothetical protein
MSDLFATHKILTAIYYFFNLDLSLFAMSRLNDFASQIILTMTVTPKVSMLLNKKKIILSSKKDEGCLLGFC